MNEKTFVKRRKEGEQPFWISVVVLEMLEKCAIVSFILLPFVYLILILLLLLLKVPLPGSATLLNMDWLNEASGLLLLIFVMQIQQSLILILSINRLSRVLQTFLFTLFDPACFWFLFPISLIVGSPIKILFAFIVSKHHIHECSLWLCPVEGPVCHCISQSKRLIPRMSQPYSAISKIVDRLNWLIRIFLDACVFLGPFELLL